MNSLRRSPTMIISLVIPAILAIGALAYTQIILVTNLASSRQKINQQRLSLVALQQEQSNLDTLRTQVTAVTAAQEKLGAEIWTFTREEDFFTFWEQLGQQPGMTVKSAQVAEAAPTGKRLIRPGSVEIDGTPTALLASLDTIQSHQPLIAIDALTLTVGNTAASIHAKLQLKTIWQ